MAEGSLNILEKENSNTEVPDQEICTLCLIQFAKYTCPRCNKRYCSLACYKSKKHSDCSESFYRDSCLKELQQHKGSAEDKRKMLEMLARLDEQDQQGELSVEDEPCLEERLAGLDLERDLDEVWERLTPAEQQDFQKTLKTGSISHMLSVYSPWWEGTPELVIPLDIEVDSKTSHDHVPAVLSNLPPLHTLIKGGSVSGCLPNNILNVLFAYAYSVRFFNGGHHDLPLQASQTMLDLSSCLSANVVFSAPGQALRAALAAVQQNHNLFNSNTFSTSILKDVTSIISIRKSRGSHVIRALSDMHKLFGTARSKLKEESLKLKDGSSTTKSEDTTSVDGSGKLLWRARKKIYFFLVWCASNEDNLKLLGSLSTIVELEHEKALLAVQEQTKVDDLVRENIASIREKHKIGKDEQHITLSANDQHESSSVRDDHGTSKLIEDLT